MEFLKSFFDLWSKLLRKRIRRLYVIASILLVMNGTYCVVLGLFEYFKSGVVTETLGMGLAFLYQAAALLPVWYMTDPKKASFIHFLSAFAFLLLFISGIPVHMVLRGQT
ncbi:hypothetical protein [Alteromonas gracilis]|nr:hypothetical protein [Alteromonas gracilis]